MNTKDAIKFLRYHIREAYYSDSINRVKYYDIRKLLLRGKRYEEMWGELYKELKYLSGDAHYKGAKILMERIEQKYFPKGGK